MKIKSDQLYSCPYCGSDNIDGDSPDPETMSRDVRCKACGCYWTEGFTFDTIIIPDEYVAIYSEKHPAKESWLRKFNPQPKPESKKKGR